MSNSSRHRGLQPTSLLCPWDVPGKNTGVGCHFLIQDIFQTQGLNPYLDLGLWDFVLLYVAHFCLPGCNHFPLPMSGALLAQMVVSCRFSDESSLEAPSTKRGCFTLYILCDWSLSYAMMGQSTGMKA